ncbi:MAG: class II glutamine amidotransferase [Serpentinimonas sp.]|nr:MAG: glutamine amidotransferase [Comamonadaceae bacterium BICA1-1]MDO8274619.1 class II glutamine amidotransferase [Serpentinimonas sp.]MDO9611465.1 class II glutamine amidotransferase [Serpentinimonas sp.]
MCQLLGLNCATPTDAQFSFSGLRRRGGATDHHADGWGIAFFEGKGLRLFVDCESAAHSPMAEFLRHYPLKSTHIIAHVRKATEGAVRLENTHPFCRVLWGRHWVFAHNGDLKDYRPHLHSHFHPVGDTDSERAFCWLLQELAKSHASLPSVPELTLTLRELLPQVRRHGSFNFLLSNGEALWAHCSTQLHYLVRQHPFAHATLMDEDWTVNFAEVNQPGDRAAVVVTTPLTRDECWTPFAAGELKVFVGGLPLADV